MAEKTQDRDESRPTPEQQWAKLDARLGTDKGAMLERAKLYLEMDER
ncbi:hypothetical protein [Nocardia jiangxiensis]|nr:hypothetical protein [Nocardia jiangxiensis]